MEEQTKGYLQVTGAALLWGMLVIFYHNLVGRAGLVPLQVAFFRAAITAAVLGLILSVKRRDLLRIRLRDLPLYLCFGVLGVAVFFIVYVYAIRLTGGAMAAVLLYTAPFWVALVAWRALGEPLSRVKLVALGLAFVGCILVARAYDMAQLRVNFLGVVMGLASGLCYGLYTLLYKVAVQRGYSPWTVMLYALALGALALLPLQSPAELWNAMREPATLFWLVTLALGPTLGAYFLLGESLQRLPASVVSIVAMSEPVMAAALAWVFLGQSLEVLQIVGGAAVLVGVLLLQRAGRTS